MSSEVEQRPLDRPVIPPLPKEVDFVACMVRGEKDTAEALDYYYTAEQMRDYAMQALKLTDAQIDALFDESPFVARQTMDKRKYEVVQRENPDWRTHITNDKPKHHGYFDTYDEAEAVQRRLHTRWVLSGGV